jgi:hypothetical protein
MLVSSVREESDMAQQEPSGGGYGGGYKRNWVKYLVIYLVVAGAAYALIYFLFFNDGGYF